MGSAKVRSNSIRNINPCLDPTRVNMLDATHAPT